MKLYHGSNVEVKVPDLLRSRPFKDFGQGFYLSPLYEQAMERALQTKALLQDGIPFVSIFEWNDEEAIRAGLSIKIFDGYSCEWAQFVLANRDRKADHPVHNYDIVIGPIADDGVTYQLRRYREGDLTMERLIEELKYAKGLTIQYFFRTERSLSFLSKL